MILLFPAILTALATASVAPTCGDSLARTLSDRLTPLLSESAAQGRFSGVVLVACNGRPVFSGAYGMANRAKRVKNSLETRFNLGSMNKMWTAVAIAQLVEAGKVEVDAPVGRYLPDLPNHSLRDRVLVRHLLTHTSGLGSYFARGYLSDRVPLKAAADLLSFFVEDSLSFEPGARFQYSNAGFAVLGMIVERVSGLNYYDYLRRHVLERAGMTDARFVTQPSADPQLAIGYTVPPGATDTVESTDLVERTSSPAGGAYATAADLVAFSRALWDGRLVSRAIVDDFTRGKVDMGPLKYAYGFGDGSANGWRNVGHNGGAPGVSADFKSFPDHGIDVVVLSNLDRVAGQVMGGVVSALTSSGAGGRQPAPSPAEADRRMW